MATDYSKKKNDELQDLLRARSLPHTGKKADLIARLQQHDAETAKPDKPTRAPAPSGKSAATAIADDEIDWDDEAGPAANVSKGSTTPNASTAKAPKPTAPGAAALAAGGQGQIANPQAVPNQAIAVDPSTTSDLTVKQPETEPATVTATSPTPAESKELNPPTDSFSNNLPSTSISTELEKRKARAARFGTAPASAPTDSSAAAAAPTDSTKEPTDDEDAKAAARATRFGTDTKAVMEEEKVERGVKGLDSALPERAVRKRGRGREKDGDEGNDRQGKRIDSRKRDGKGRNGVTGRGGNAGRGKVNGRGGKGGAAGLNEKDRLAAEARKKRFAAAPAAAAS